MLWPLGRIRRRQILRRRLDPPLGPHPSPVHWALQELRPNDKMEPAWSGPVPVPALYRNPAHCGGLVARPSPAFARRPPPVPPCRPSGVRGKSVLPGGGGGSLPGLLVALCPRGRSAGSRPCSAPGSLSPRSVRLPPGLLGRAGSWPGGLCRPAAGLAALWRLAALVRLCRRAARRRAFSPVVSVPGRCRWVGPGA